MAGQIVLTKLVRIDSVVFDIYQIETCEKFRLPHMSTYRLLVIMKSGYRFTVYGADVTKLLNLIEEYRNITDTRELDEITK